MTAFLAGVPFAVQAGGSMTHDGARHLQQTQQETRSRVAAITLEPMPPEGQSRAAAFAIPVVAASWDAPGGRMATGRLPVVYGTPAGTKIWVWTTTSGKLADPPLTDDQVASLTTLGQALSALTAAALFALAWALTRMGLDRRRYAAWEADWQATDSQGRQRK
jgi:hypothetical protein